MRKAFTPRPYLSYSQIVAFERGPEEYKRVYLYGKKRTSREMEFGSLMAEGLEAEEDGDDQEVNFLRMAWPGPKMREKWIDVTLEGIPLRARLDGLTLEPKLVIDENKTGKAKWTQAMADRSGQITMYWLMVWKETGRWPDLARLNYAQTAEDGAGRIFLTGKVKTFETARTMSDVLSYYSRHIKPAWIGIRKLCEEELEKIG